MLPSTSYSFVDDVTVVTIISGVDSSLSEVQTKYDVSVATTQEVLVPDDLPQWFRTACYFVLSFITALSVICLCSLVFASYKHKHSWTPSHSVVLSTIFSQLCMQITVLCSMRYLLDICEFRFQAGIKIYFVVLFSNASNALTHLAAFTTDISIKIRHPFLYARIAQTWIFHGGLALIWITSIIIGSCMLLWIEFPPYLDGIECLFFHAITDSKITIVIFTNVCSISLVVVAVVQEVIVIRTARKQAMRIRDQTRSVERPCTNTVTCTEDVEQPRAATGVRGRIQERMGPIPLRTIAASATLIFSLIICWSALILMFDLFILKGMSYVYHAVITFVSTFNLSGFGWIVFTYNMADYRTVLDKFRVGIIITLNNYWNLFFPLVEKKVIT